jgi:putative colanic acid biosynthesis UDP-glucose lipid carrier transferase
MDQQITIGRVALERSIPQIVVDSDINRIRSMFDEINQRYMVHRPASNYITMKRLMDISISVFFLIFFMSWMLPLVALLIKLTSRGPLFFIQKRTGYQGVEFNCYKFRTMYVNDDAHRKQVSINDIRITLIGRFLRITHIDEIPQFLNVLQGEMSIVGPRPHMLVHTKYYAQRIPYYNLRHETKPGMTGMAQIKNYIGEINGDRELRKRIQWDVYYLKHRSLALDIRIVFTTLWHVVLKILCVKTV